MISVVAVVVGDRQARAFLNQFIFFSFIIIFLTQGALGLCTAFAQSVERGVHAAEI